MQERTNKSVDATIFAISARRMHASPQPFESVNQDVRRQTIGEQKWELPILRPDGLTRWNRQDAGERYVSSLISDRPIQYSNHKWFYNTRSIRQISSWSHHREWRRQNIRDAFEFWLRGRNHVREFCNGISFSGIWSRNVRPKK